MVVTEDGAGFGLRLTNSVRSSSSVLLEPFFKSRSRYSKAFVGAADVWLRPFPTDGWGWVTGFLLSNRLSFLV